ncbi:MAG: hypothetical protein V3U91_04795 [Candidatus Aminicenantaceae bacterium]
MQELLELPASLWDFKDFYSDKPDADLFPCRALVAGAVSIYLDVITKGGIDRTGLQTGEKESLERVIHLFNAFLLETSGGGDKDPADFDPFIHDEYLKTVHIHENARKEYANRVTKLFTAFQKQFGVRDCVDILGFDPFRYDEYDEETQEAIEEGEWMKKCSECMESIIKTICANQ